MVAGDQADGPGHANIRGLSLPVPPSHPCPLIRLNERITNLQIKEFMFADYRFADNFIITILYVRNF